MSVPPREWIEAYLRDHRRLQFAYANTEASRPSVWEDDLLALITPLKHQTPISYLAGRFFISFLIFPFSATRVLDQVRCSATQSQHGLSGWFQPPTTRQGIRWHASCLGATMHSLLKERLIGIAEHYPFVDRLKQAISESFSASYAGALLSMVVRSAVEFLLLPLEQWYTRKLANDRTEEAQPLSDRIGLTYAAAGSFLALVGRNLLYQLPKFLSMAFLPTISQDSSVQRLCMRFVVEEGAVLVSLLIAVPLEVLRLRQLVSSKPGRSLWHHALNNSSGVGSLFRGFLETYAAHAANRAVQLALRKFPRQAVF